MQGRISTVVALACVLWRLGCGDDVAPAIAETPRVTETTSATATGFLEWKLDDWVAFARNNGLDREAILERNSYVGWDRRTGSELRMEVVFTRGSLEHVAIGETSQQGGAPESRVMEAWKQIDRGAELRLKKIRDEQRSQGRSAGPIDWIGRTPYACGWTENNKGYVIRVGPQSEHKRLVRYRNEIAELVISWGDCIQKSRAKAAEAVKAGTPDGIDVARRELAVLALAFRHVDAIDREMLSFHDRQSGYLEYSLWDDWPVRATGKLFAAAARCSDICSRAERQLAEGRLDFNPYREMWIVIGQDAAAAPDRVFGEYGRLADHEEVAKWPESLDKRWTEVHVRALAEQMEKSNESDPGG